MCTRNSAYPRLFLIMRHRFTVFCQTTPKKGLLCIFNWLKPSENLRSHRSGSSQHLPGPAQTPAGLKKKRGGRPREGHHHEALLSTRQEPGFFHRALEKMSANAHKYQPKCSRATACLCVTCQCNGCHIPRSVIHNTKQAYFLILSGCEDGEGASFPTETAACTSWPGKLRGQILHYTPAPKGA